MEDLERQALDLQEGRREGSSPARAPPPYRPAPHLPTLRAQSRLRFPSGEREKVPARPPPLKGAAPPLPLHHSYRDSALSLRHLSGTLKAWISPSSRELLPRSVAIGTRRIGRAGLEVGFAWRSRAAATGKGRSRHGQHHDPRWTNQALALRGTVICVQLPGMRTSAALRVPKR